MFDLFGYNHRYHDEARSIYEDFISYFKNRKIVWGLKYKKEFYKLVQALSKISEDNTLADQAKTDPLLAEELKKYEDLKKGLGIANFLAQHGRVIIITGVDKRMKDAKTTKKFNLRKLLDSYFCLYPDDKVRFTLKLHKIVFFEAEGQIKDIFVPLEKMQNLPMNMGKEELLTVEMVLLEEGQERVIHEDLSNIYETDREIDSYLSRDFQVEALNKLPEDLKKERLKMFNVESSEQLTEGKDFGFKNLSAFPHFFDRLHDPKYSNEMLLESDDQMMEIEYDKMRQWLTRSNPDGFNGYV